MPIKPVIKPKKKPVIQKGSGLTYNPDTFDTEHVEEYFKVVEDPQEIIDNLVPFTFMLDEEELQGISFDTETVSFSYGSHEAPLNVVRRWVGSGKKAKPQDIPFVISICDSQYCYTIYDTPENNFKKFKTLSAIFENPNIVKWAHNTKFDQHQFANIGMKIKGKIFDTLVLVKLIDENRMSYKLRDLAKPIGGNVKYEEMVDNYKLTNKITRYDAIPPKLLGRYANADVFNCKLVALHYLPQLDKPLTQLFKNEMELSMVAFDMERTGMLVNKDYEIPLKAELQQLTDDAERAIYELAGRMFNINSAKQLYEVLIEQGVSDSLVERTEKGNPKLDKDALQCLADKHNVTIVKNILEYRKASKMLGTYAEGIYEQRDSQYRVHPSINTAEARTGRMSITKPALQTLHKKEKRIRKMFIPPVGYKLYFADLDQVEYRIYAHYAKIQSLIENINNGYDVHAATAATIFNKNLEDFVKKVHEGDEECKQLRQKAKTLNFALLYGVGVSHLAELLGCTDTEASDIKSKYFANIPEARQLIQAVERTICNRGYVYNYYGRRRRLSKNESYKATNSLIQGCAADYIKFKIVNIYKFLKYNNYKSRLVNVIHDEIVIELADDEEFLMPYLRWLMSDFESFRVNITAGCEIAKDNWSAKEEVECGFKEPEDKEYLTYDVYNGDVFKERSL